MDGDDAGGVTVVTSNLGAGKFALLGLLVCVAQDLWRTAATRPSENPELDELASAAITTRYVEHRDSDPLALLAELATGTEIANRTRQRRCATMREALRAGVTVEQVAAAVDTDPGEVSAALIEWADGQRRDVPDRFSEDDVAEVCARAGV